MHAGKPRTGPGAQKVGKGRAGRQKQEGGADSRGHDRDPGSQPLSEHVAASERQDRGPGQRERNHGGIGQCIDANDQGKMLGDLLVQPVAIGLQRLQREIALEPQGEEQAGPQRDGEQGQPAANSVSRAGFWEALGHPPDVTSPMGGRHPGQPCHHIVRGRCRAELAKSGMGLQAALTLPR